MTNPKLSKFDRQRIWESEQNKLPGIFIPIRVGNALNIRLHHMARHREAQRIRKTVGLYLLRGRPSKALPATVTFSRFGPKRMDDDGLSASLKHARDAVADYFGADDGDSRFTWKYAQEQSPFYGVRVEIESAGGK